MSDEADPYSVWNMSEAELEAIAVAIGIHAPAKLGAARAELSRRRRVHERDLVDRQLAAAKSVRWATIMATVAAMVSALGAVAQGWSTLGPWSQTVIEWLNIR